MKKIALIVALCSAMIFTAVNSEARRATSYMPHSGPLMICGVDISEAIGNIPEVTNSPIKSEDILGVLLLAGIGPECGDPRSLGDLPPVTLLMFIEGRSQNAFGLFNVVFNKDGKSIILNTLKTWEITSNSDDQVIFRSWCFYLKSSYPQDFKEQCEDN